jgi:O-antigen ligase
MDPTPPPNGQPIDHDLLYTSKIDASGRASWLRPCMSGFREGAVRLGLSQTPLKRVCAAAALGLILLGLCTGGAQTAAAAALFAAGLCLVLAAAAATAADNDLANLVQRHRLSSLAALGFVVYVLASAWISPVAATPGFVRALWHPLWAELSPGQGAISLAPYRTLEGLAAFFAPLAAFAVGALTVRDRDDRRLLGLLLTGAAVVFALLALYWFWSGGEDGERLMARLGSANSAATAFGVFALMLAARVLRLSRRPNPKALAQLPPRLRGLSFLFTAPATLSALALTLGCLLLTESRAGIASSVGAFALFGLLILWSRRGGDAANASRTAIAGVALLGVVLLALGGPIALNRMISFSEDAGIRQTLIDMHWRIFLERPWLGHGLNTFHQLNAHYLTPETWRDANFVGAVHNIYVQALEEVGVVGFALLALMLAPAVLRAGRAAARRRSGAEWAAAACAAMALALAHGFVDFGLQTPAIAALTLFCLGAFSNGERAAKPDAHNAK